MPIKLGTNAINAIKLGTNNVSKVCVGSVEIYNSNPIDYTEPFYIENPDSTDHDAVFVTAGDTGQALLHYSYNPLHAQSSSQAIPSADFDGEENIYPYKAGGRTTVTIPAESRVYFYIDSEDMYNDGLRRLSDGTNYVSIDADDIVNIGGNIMSLLYGEHFTGNERSFDAGSTHNFFQLFADSVYIYDASNLILPATTLNANCYQSMFRASFLVTAPTTLPATTLASLCCAGMFSSCTHLTTPPASLPATTAASRCYYNMFLNCSSLTTAPTIGLTTTAQSCCEMMFDGCSSLTTAPVLHAATMTTDCYNQMFYNCTSLNSVTVEATTWNSNYAAWWLDGVSATGTFTKPTNTTITTGVNGIPSGWTVVNK